jgi:hypothetical protein
MTAFDQMPLWNDSIFVVEFSINIVCILNYWGVHPVARVSSNVNKPPYATMFLVLVFIVHLHYMFRPLIGGHLQVICDKIYSKVATILCQRIR